MSAEAYAMGHKIIADTIIDEVVRSGAIIHVQAHTGRWCYADTGEPYNNDHPRPCISCGERATSDGHDPCIANLPGVVNACCGHGVEEGYIMFADGRMVKGTFTVENK